MSAKSGQVAALYVSDGTSQTTTGEACTQVGATAEYYITDRTKSWLDPDKTFTVYDGVTVVVPLVVDWAAGMFTLAAVAVGAVTVDCAYFTPVCLGGVTGWTTDNKLTTHEITAMPCIVSGPAYWRKYIAGLREWAGNADRFYWSVCASKTVDCTNDNSDLTWSLLEWGTPGNLRSVEYLGGTDQTLEVTYNAGTKKFTVQCATTGTTITSTAAQIKAHVAADPVLAALVAVTYPGAQTGAGVVEAKTAAYFTGGRDITTDFAKIGNKVLFRFYLNIVSGSEEILSGVGWLTGVPADAKIDGVQMSNLSFQGEGRLKYHAYPII